MIFFKKSKPLDLKVDIHSHLLPGIDDGAKTLDESVSLIKKFISLGYEKLIITPHVMEDAYNNSTQTILEKFRELKSAVSDLDIELEVSAEYYVDEEFLKRLDNDDILPIKDKYVLFETSYYEKPLNLEEVIFKIQAKGYIPVFAHPERYRYIENMDYYHELKNRGVLFQCNINSFGGFYGKTALRKAEYLAKNKMIDFLGSDAHNMKYLESMEKNVSNGKFVKMLSKNQIKNSLL